MPLPTATQYVSDADADNYFIGSFNHAEWFALSVGEKTVALHEATRWLEQLCFKGEKCDPAQPLKWPRTIAATDCCAAVDCTTMPPQMVQATCELALQLHKNQTAIIGAGTTGGIKKAQLGGLSVEYFESATTAKVSDSAPLVLQQFPWLVDLLGCVADLKVGNSRIIARVRS